MATGDASNIVSRIKALLPPWFTDTTPVRDALLAAFGSAWSFAYGLYAYAQMQTRIATASDGWLDLIALDFFGSSLRRTTNQTDTVFRNRITANLFVERATRAGMVRALTQLTGAAPTIFEPTRPFDTGVYGGPMIGYSLAGGYGSLLLPFQAFITVNIPAGTGIPMVAGYRTQTSGYGVASRGEYASLGMSAAQVQLGDIYTTIDAVKPVASIMWTAIGPTASRMPTVLGLNFVMGDSTLGA